MTFTTPAAYDAIDFRRRGTGGAKFPPTGFIAHPGPFSEVRNLDSKRTLAVHASRFVASLAALSMITVFVGCEGEEETTVAPPAPPPQITTVQAYSGLPDNDVFAMLVLSNGEFWIGTEQGIAVYASVTATQRMGLVNELNGLPNPKVRDLAELDSKVYVATWGGGFAIYDIAGNTWTSRSVANGLRNSSVTDIEVSPDENKVYMATNDGVSIYDPVADTFASFTTLTRPVVGAVAVRNSMSGFERWYGPRVESIEDESQGPLPAAGITVSRGAAVFTYTMVNSGLPEANVNAIFYDSGAGALGEDLFWVATANNGVSQVSVDQSTWTTYTTVQGLPSNTVYSVARIDGTIWVATQNGVARLKVDGTWQGYNTGGGLAADRVRRVYTDDGQRLLIGYIKSGAARLDPNSAQ